ncbi:hypothetical protein [Carboxylicivirga sp. N1Y90]|uniref:hypothetical protein n=1 Tax=Carboxylicivirga fragile TaxID=3417571 RepID=UPI003D33FFAF|nr:hypothetical protein [Marinilabiliaceae bacterium N1Y90]
MHFCFKQWSRKGYAIFNSLGRVVHISALSTSVSQSIGQLVVIIDSIIHQILEDEEDDDIMLSKEDLLVLQPVTIDIVEYLPELIKTTYKLPLLRIMP